MLKSNNLFIRTPKILSLCVFIYWNSTSLLKMMTHQKTDWFRYCMQTDRVIITQCMLWIPWILQLCSVLRSHKRLETWPVYSSKDQNLYINCDLQFLRLLETVNAAVCHASAGVWLPFTGSLILCNNKMEFQRWMFSNSMYSGFYARVENLPL